MLNDYLFQYFCQSKKALNTYFTSHWLCASLVMQYAMPPAGHLRDNLIKLNPYKIPFSPSHQASSVEPRSPAPASGARGFYLWAAATADPPLTALRLEPGAAGRPSETRGWSESPAPECAPWGEPASSRRPEPQRWASEGDPCVQREEEGR